MNDARECSRFAARLTLLPPSRAASATLLACPPLNPGNYVLVRREPEGGATLLALGRLVSHTPSLNLAMIRRRGAELGANEVHWFASGGP